MNFFKYMYLILCFVVFQKIATANDEVYLQNAKQTSYFSRAGTGVDPLASSKKNIEKIKDEILNYPDIGGPITEDEMRLMERLDQIDWTLKHLTEHYDNISKTQEFLSPLELKNRKIDFWETNSSGVPGQAGYIFFTLGSPQHNVADFLESEGLTLIEIPLKQRIKDNKLCNEFSYLHFMDLIYAYQKNKTFVHEFGDTYRREDFFSYDDIRRAYKKYTYERKDGSILTRTVEIGEESSVGEDLFKFLKLYVIRELRYIGGSYKKHVYDHLNDLNVVEAMVDTFFQMHSFEAKMPIILNYSQLDHKVTFSYQKPLIYDQDKNTESNITAFHNAIDRGDIDTVKHYLIKIGVSPNIPFQSKSALGRALFKHKKIADLLIEYGAEFNDFSIGFSFTGEDIQNQFYDVAKKILASFCTNCRDPMIRYGNDLWESRIGLLYLRYFAFKNDIVAIKNLFRMGFRGDRFDDFSLDWSDGGATYLNYLSNLTHRDDCFKSSMIGYLNESIPRDLLMQGNMMKELLELGVHPDNMVTTNCICRPFVKKNYPLMKAAMLGRFDDMKLLSDCGANIYQKDEYGRNLLDLIERRIEKIKACNSNKYKYTKNREIVLDALNKEACFLREKGLKCSKKDVLKYRCNSSILFYIVAHHNDVFKSKTNVLLLKEKNKEDQENICTLPFVKIDGLATKNDINELAFRDFSVKSFEDLTLESSIYRFENISEKLSSLNLYNSFLRDPSGSRSNYFPMRSVVDLYYVDFKDKLEFLKLSCDQPFSEMIWVDIDVLDTSELRLTPETMHFIKLFKSILKNENKELVKEETNDFFFSSFQ